MGLREKLRDKVAPFLEPDERIQAIFPAQTMSPYWVLITFWILIVKNRYRVVVVTNKRILVLNSGRWRLTAVKEAVREVDRNTLIGPAKGLQYRCDSLGERLYV